MTHKEHLEYSLRCWQLEADNMEAERVEAQEIADNYKTGLVGIHVVINKLTAELDKCQKH